MPILAVDKFGRLYESDPDRHDGLGYKGEVPKTDYGDLTLGNAFLRAESKRARQQTISSITQAIQDQQDRMLAQARALRARNIKRAQDMARDAERNQASQDYLVMKGALQTMREESPTQIGLSGDGMYANGMGAPKPTIYPVDKEEADQAQLQKAVYGALSQGEINFDGSVRHPSFFQVPVQEGSRWMLPGQNATPQMMGPSSAQIAHPLMTRIK